MNDIDIDSMHQRCLGMFKFYFKKKIRNVYEHDKIVSWMSQ